MGRKPARNSIERLIVDARFAGYTVREADEFPKRDGTLEIMLDIEGHGDLFEAYFVYDPHTDYWRWHRGFRHVGVGGDRYPTLRAFRAIVFAERSSS